MITRLTLQALCTVALGAIVVSPSGASAASVFRGTFDEYDVPAAGTSVLADLDGDGIQDVAVVSEPLAGNAVTVFLGEGGGVFSAHAEYPIGRQPLGLACRDINGDRSLDLVS